jgi:hypothetical protein
MPLGHITFDRSQEHDLEWVCFIRDNGECWTFRNPDVRLAPNATLGIRTIDGQ